MAESDNGEAMTFRDTYEALAFGRNATQEQIEKLQSNRMRKLEIAHKLRQENQIDWAFQVLFSAQMDREATEAYKAVNL